MQEKYAVLDYPIRLALARELKDCAETWEKISRDDTLTQRATQNAKDNADYYRRHLAAVESTL